VTPGDGRTCFVVPYHPDRPSSVDHLREAVGSVLTQTDDRWLLVIVHDPCEGAPDQGPFLDSLVRPLGDRAGIVDLARTHGPGGARNAGVDWAAAHGAGLIAFLDADDVCEPHRLATLHAAFEARPRAGFVYSSFTVIDEESLPRLTSDLPAPIAEILAQQTPEDRVLLRPWREMACERGYMSLTSTVAVRTDVALRCRFPETMVSEDTHAWLRMFALCEEVLYLADRLTRYRVPRVPRGSASRERSGDGFYWTKALVDADACFRVLMDEMAAGALGRREALEALTAFWHRVGATLEHAGAGPVATVVSGLSAVDRSGSVLLPAAR
jgi:glycosyltransferase involved in cell wall biosynthesis